VGSSADHRVIVVVACCAINFIAASVVKRDSSADVPIFSDYGQ
jgi:hypothetical protein